MTFEQEARVAAIAWKQRSPVLPDAARRDAPCALAEDKRTDRAFGFCLPAGYAEHNLLPAVRGSALRYFAGHAIPWHNAVAAGLPSNHLLDSQVQCANALEPLTSDPEGLRGALEGVVDIAEPLTVEDGRLVGFEWIGSRDYLGEVVGGQPRVRGSRTTSADAVVRYRTSGGRTEVALVEWKYTEQYIGKKLGPDPRGIRQRRYEAWWDDPDGPLRTDVLPYDDLFVEPFYQLMRLTLLAHAMERAGELDAERVRLVYMAPARNAELRASLDRDSHRDLGDDVLAIWPQLLRRPDRFAWLDTSRFLDASMEPHPAFADRYGHVSGDMSPTEGEATADARSAMHPDPSE